MISERLARSLGEVYAPIFTWEDNEFIFATLKDMYETEEGAKEAMFQVGLDLMAKAGVGYTGKVQVVPSSGGQPGVCIDFPEGRFVFLSGPLYDTASEGSVDDIRDELERFMDAGGYRIEN